MTSRPHGDAGAASVEYAGFLVVVGLVVASLLVHATPLGAALQARICAAFGAVCGSAAAEQRAAALGVKCTVARTSRDLGWNLAVTGYRGERLDTDAITAFGDGTAQVVLSQGAGVGVDGSSTLGGRGAELTAKATVNGDLGHVYSFPSDLGGAGAAQDFLGEERDGLGQAVDLVLPGAQAVDEAGTRLVGGARDFVQDRLLAPVGLGPSDAERAAREREQRASTADALTVALSVQGSAGVDVGAGVPLRSPDGSPGGSVEGPLRAGASVKVVVKGSSTIGLTTGQSDSVASSFTGSATVDADLALVLGVPGDTGQVDLPPFLSVTGQAGAAGSYKVVFDAQGEPSQLVLAYEHKIGGKAGLAPPKLGSRQVKVDVNAGAATVTERTVVLDLADSAEGRANRAAFDATFAVVGVSVDGRTAKVAVPDTTDVAGFVGGWAALSERIDRDGFVVDATYTDTRRADDVGLKVAGTGVGGQRSTTTRQLTGASLYDNRAGGAEVALASCAAP